MKEYASNIINDAEQDNRRAEGCNTYFCIGFPKIWRKIHRITKILCCAKCLKWVRIQMTYSRFLNLVENIQVDFVSKPTKGLALKYFFQ